MYMLDDNYSQSTIVLQDSPDWLSTEDWILIKVRVIDWLAMPIEPHPLYPTPLQGLTAILEFPLSLNCTVPAQTPNWSILADLVSSYSKNKRSPLQVIVYTRNTSFVIR